MEDNKTAYNKWCFCTATTGDKYTMRFIFNLCSNSILKSFIISNEFSHIKQKYAYSDSARFTNRTAPGRRGWALHNLMPF